jgi:hypothetical protein
MAQLSVDTPHMKDHVRRKKYSMIMGMPLIELNYGKNKAREEDEGNLRDLPMFSTATKTGRRVAKT